MSRRIAVVVVALVAGLLLSSCGSAKDRDAVVQVGSATLSHDDVEALMSDQLLIAQMQTPQITNGTVELSAVDSVATVWTWLEAASQQGLADLDDETIATQWYTNLDTSQGTADNADSKQSLYAASTGVARNMMTRLGVANTMLSDSSQTAFTVDALQVAARQADVVVDSRFGYWDADNARIVPMGMVIATTTTAAATTTSTAAG